MHSEFEQKALQWVYSSGTTTRAALIDTLGISQASVNRLVTDLRRRGYLVERQTTTMSVGRGRPSLALAINPDCGFVAGIEFGRESLIIGFVAADGTLLHWEIVDSPPDFSPSDKTMSALMQILNTTVKAQGLRRSQLRGIGLALHGIVSQNAEWLNWEQKSETLYPVRNYLSRHVDCLIHVEDVSRAFAEAEHRFGAGRDHADMVYLFVGRHGIGSGIFVNNVLLNSSLGICGEIGHITVEREGLPCQCGNRGCLETVATHDAVVARVINRLADRTVSVLSEDDISFAAVCKAYCEGDKLAHIILNELAEDLATALSSTINIVGATLVIIGGQLRLAGSDFLTSLSNLLRQQILPSLAQRLNIGYAELPICAGIYGVASQALDVAWRSGSFLATSETV